MSRAEPIRCVAPHPDDPRRPCNARLFDAVPGTVDVREGDTPPPGCTAQECWRCGAKYVACARRVA